MCCTWCSNCKQDFDKMLHEKWQKVEESGICKYKLQVTSKRIPGKHDFVIQGSSQRVGNRRSPQLFSSVSMPFDKTKFNFSKISPNEILFHICINQRNCCDNSMHSVQIDSNINPVNLDNVVVANVSPFAEGHILLVPQLLACRPQILTYDALKLALELQWLSKRSNFITVYNSMCGQASVNHLHLHSYYFMVPDDSSDLMIQKVCSLERQLSTNCYVCESIPVPAFYFEITRHCDIDSISRETAAIVDHLVKRNIAHNLSIVKGKPATCHGAVNGESQCDSTSVLKLFLWPRMKVYKREYGINVGACELSGHVFVPDELYRTITHYEILTRIQSVLLPKKEFESLIEEVKEVLNCEKHS